MEFKSSQVTFI